MTPGWKTSEFWITLAAQLIAVLTVVGIIPSSDAAHVQDSATKCIIAAFVLVMNGIVVLRYIEHRSNLKIKWLDAWIGDDDPPPDQPPTPPAAPADTPNPPPDLPNGSGGLLAVLLAVVAFCGFASSVQAQ